MLLFVKSLPWPPAPLYGRLPGLLGRGFPTKVLLEDGTGELARQEDVHAPPLLGQRQVQVPLRAAAAEAAAFAGDGGDRRRQGQGVGAAEYNGWSLHIRAAVRLRIHWHPGVFWEGILRSRNK